jgi:ankyrin repeat protein
VEEAAPAQLALEIGTVPPDVVAQYRVALEEADYDWRGMLYVACERRALRVVHWALAIGADANEEEGDKSCPAHAACGYGHPKVLAILAAHGANLDKPDMDGWTPAHVASSNGNGEVLWVLAALGADMNAVNEYNGRSVANVWKMPLP